MDTAEVTLKSNSVTCSTEPSSSPEFSEAKHKPQPLPAKEPPKQLALVNGKFQVVPLVRHTQKLTGQSTPGRNKPCLCGSGKKFKHCHGARSNGQ